MVERKLRPAPSQVLSLPQRKAVRTDKAHAAATNPDVSKLFVLDTNVLMHDPTSLFRFEEHDVYLPMVTLEELDDHKKGMSEVARNARQASRFLDEIVSSGQGDLETGYSLKARGNADATGRLLLYDGAVAELQAIKVRRDPGCPACGTLPLPKERAPR